MLYWVSSVTASQPTHAITILVLGHSERIPISPDKYEEIRTAHRFVMFGLSVEEKLDLLLQNFLALEECLVGMALENSVFTGDIENHLTGATLRVNRHVANLLTSARLYLDQLLHEVSAVYGYESEEFRKVKELTHNQYDSVFGYRVMEALRNHVQHRALPVHGMKFPMTRLTDTPESKLGFAVVPFAIVSKFEDDKEFKKSVLDELQNETDKKGDVTLMPYARSYVECIAKIHIGLRDTLSEDLAAADTLFDHLHRQAELAFGRCSPALAAVSINENGTYGGRVMLSDQPIQRRRSLEKRNKYMDSISRHVVSTDK